MRLALFLVSLALNVFLIGFIIGDFARPIRAVQSLGELSSHYPEAIQRELRANVHADRRVLAADFRAFNALRAELFAVMRAPEFDSERVRALMAEVRVQTTALQLRLQEATFAAVSAAPPATRAEIETPVVGQRFGLSDE